MQFAVDAAKRLGVFGYAKRLPTGAIHIEAEGEEKRLEEFLEECRRHEDWREENEKSIVFSDLLFGYGRFYIRKQG